MAKVSEISGALLDLWVAKAEGLPLCGEAMQVDYILVGTGEGDLRHFSPSTEWDDGGPIIEREGIAMRKMDYMPNRGDWSASVDHFVLTAFYGPTPLIAAMRAYVASKFGAEVAEVTP